MSDLYTEKLIKRKTPASENAMRAVLIAATALSAVGIVFTPFAIPALVALAAADFIMIPRFDLEYEYLYVNGELDIDKIMSKTKRKHVASFSVNNLELLAPYQSHELDAFKNDRAVQVFDCSSGQNQDVYGMVMIEEGAKKLLIFEPNEIMVHDIKRRSPRRVKEY